MTIYATVNNLISDADSEESASAIWTVISGAGILQGGNPYFVPDFATRFEARTALALKIGKLGKGVSPRFTSRYVDSIAPAVLFVAADLLEDLRRKGLPWSRAVSYDKCLALGKFVNVPYENIVTSNIGLILESADSASRTDWTGELIRPGIEQTLSELSRDNTLKTGDIILLGISERGYPVVPDLRATLKLNGEDSLKFNIR